MTGVTFLAPELVGKRLALLKEAAPAISRVAVIGASLHPASGANGAPGKTLAEPWA